MDQNKSYQELMALYGAKNGNTQQKGNAMLELIMGRKPYSYDPKTDPAAQAARKQTTRNVGVVTQDTLGSLAGMTGGVPSTAAVSAAAQAGHRAAAEGEDRIAELERLAFANYQTEGQNMANIWSMLQQQNQNELALAQLAANYGDTSKLKALGINASGGAGGSVSGGTGGGSKRYDDSDGIADEKTTDAELYNQLLGTYGTSVLTEQQWAEAKEKYGEAKLRELGFTKKVAATLGGRPDNPIRPRPNQPDTPSLW